MSELAVALAPVVAAAAAAAVAFIGGRRWERARTFQAEAGAELSVAQAIATYSGLTSQAWELAQQAHDLAEQTRTELGVCKALGKEHQSRWELATPVLERCADEVPELRVKIAELKASVRNGHADA